MEQIVRHVTMKAGLHYVLHWYVYSSKENTSKPPVEHLKSIMWMLTGGGNKNSLFALNESRITVNDIVRHGQRSEITDVAPKNIKAELFNYTANNCMIYVDITKI